MAKHRFSRYIRVLLFLGDILVLNGLFFSLYFTGHFIIHTGTQSWFAFLGVLNASWLVIVFYTNPYKVARIFSFQKITGEVTYSIFQHFLVTCTAIYLLDFQLVHKWGPLLVYCAFLFFVLLWRLTFLYLLRRYRERGNNLRAVVVVGYGAISRQLEHFFNLHPEHGYRLVGYFDDTHRSPKVLGDLESLREFVQKKSIDEIYCCLPYVRYDAIKRIIDLGDDNFIRVKLIADYRAFSFKGLELERYDHIPVLNVTSIPLDDRRNQAVKRVFDIVFSILVMIFVLSWLFPLLALIIKLDSRGPVLFRQRRTGLNNREFTCYKFRTMVQNDESDTRQAIQNDARVTRIGALMRRTSLDELPQFFNTLRGDMSVVGPRPHPIRLNEKFGPLINKYMMRHYVKPGVTGLAQAMGYRGETRLIRDMRNRITLDRFYIENWSFYFDIKIVLMTVISVIRGNEKAY